ncbi:MAG: hypothetical protein ACOYIG_07540, partial [Acetivibrionales bacterium]
MPFNVITQDSPDIFHDKGPLSVFVGVVGDNTLSSPVLGVEVAGIDVVEGLGVVEFDGDGVGVGLLLGTGVWLGLGVLFDVELLPSVKTMDLPSDEVEK